MANNNKSILKQAESLYNAKAVNENTLGNSANLIFDMEIEKMPFILRVSECNDKKKNHIDFELNWMNYLSGKLDNIVKPIKSTNNTLYEIINVDDKDYILCAFEKAKGKTVDCRNSTEFNENLFLDLGALMGNMHRLTVEYDGNVVKPEFEWDKSTFFWDEYNVILDEQVQPFTKKYINEIHALPKSKDCYGIIHQDIHLHNFFVDKGHIALFDFDDCHFSWYACDIANALFHMVQLSGPYQNEKERTEFAEAYLLSYLNGYTQTNTIDEYWIYKFDLFMRYRMVGSYKFVQNNWKDEPVNPHQDYLDWHKNRIINDWPYITIDYKKIISGVPSIIRTV